LCDVGAAVQEVMESHEVEINKKIYDVKVITGLCGHSIEPYNLHAGKSVPSYDNKDQTKMEECEFYAIETFGSTGTGTIRDDVDCSHYMKEFNGPKVNLKSPSAKKLLNLIDKEFGTLAFCRRYLTRIGEENHVLALHSLVQAGIVNDYPPLVDKKGSFTAQFEHTFVLKPTCKEILTKGEDY
jgi:methionyl aminopeptidase